MKKAILIIGLLLVGCDDSAKNETNKQHTANMQVKNMDYFLAHRSEIQPTLNNCIEIAKKKLAEENSSWSIHDDAECEGVAYAHHMLRAIEMMGEKISVEAFRRNHPVALEYAYICESAKNILPPEHPICENLLLLRAQLKEECEREEKQNHIASLEPKCLLRDTLVKTLKETK